MKLAHVTGKSSLIAVAAAIGGLVAGIGLDRAVLAQQEPIKRTTLQKVDDPGSAKYEMVMGVAEIAPGASSGRHRHPGVELGYVLEGSLVLEHDGRPTETLKAGSAFKNDGVHNGRNTGKVPVKVLAVYLVEKGKPIAEPVK